MWFNKLDPLSFWRGPFCWADSGGTALCWRREGSRVFSRSLMRAWGFWGERCFSWSLKPVANSLRQVFCVFSEPFSSLMPILTTTTLFFVGCCAKAWLLFGPSSETAEVPYGMLCRHGLRLPSSMCQSHGNPTSSFPCSYFSSCPERSFPSSSSLQGFCETDHFSVYTDEPVP